MNLFSVLAQGNWWEPGQTDMLDIGDASAIFMFFLAVIGALTAFSRWWFKKLRRMIREEIEEFTMPIQPNANGGKSLPDVARKVDVLEERLLELKTSSDDTRELMVNLFLKYDKNNN